MFRRFRRRTTDEPEINLIPMIDLLLVILIFLMLSTTYNRFSRYHLTLPTAAHQGIVHTASEIGVMILRDGSYIVDSKHFPSKYGGRLSDVLSNLMTTRNILPQSAVVVISADSQAPTQSVIGVMEAVSRARVARVGFVVRDLS